jgi:hypothetical protein
LYVRRWRIETFFKQVKIEMGFVDNERVEVLAGLKEEERVITVGNEGLRPGSAVRLVGEGGEKGKGERRKAEGEKQQGEGEKAEGKTQKSERRTMN